MIFGNVWFLRLRHIIIPLGLIWIVVFFFSKRKPIQPLVTKFIILFTLILLGSLWSRYPEILFALKLKDFLYSLIYITAGSYITNLDKMKRLIFSLAIPALFTIFICLMNPGQINTSGRIIINDINPNALAADVGTSLIVLLILFYILKSNYKFILIPIIIVGLGVLFKTGSRGGTFSTLIAITIYLMAYKWDVKKIIVVVTGVVIFTILIWSGLPEEIKGRLFDISNMSGRSNFWVVPFQRLSHNPFFGIGALDEISVFYDLRWGSMLNIYLNIYIELGYLGVLVGGMAFGSLLYGIYLSATRIKDPSKYIFLSVIAFGLFSGVAESTPMRGNRAVMILFIVFIGAFSNLAAYANCLRLKSIKSFQTSKIRQ